MLYFKFSLISLGILIMMMVFKIIFKSPGIFYKIQSINVFTSLCILFLIVFIYLTGQIVFIDLALVYIIINYVGIVTILKYIQTIYQNNPEKNYDD